MGEHLGEERRAFFSLTPDADFLCRSSSDDIRGPIGQGGRARSAWTMNSHGKSQCHHIQDRFISRKTSQVTLDIYECYTVS